MLQYCSQHLLSPSSLQAGQDPAPNGGDDAPNGGDDDDDSNDEPRLVAARLGAASRQGGSQRPPAGSAGPRLPPQPRKGSRSSTPSGQGSSSDTEEQKRKDAEYRDKPDIHSYAKAVKKEASEGTVASACNQRAFSTP